MFVRSLSQSARAAVCIPSPYILLRRLVYTAVYTAVYTGISVYTARIYRYLRERQSSHVLGRKKGMAQAAVRAPAVLSGTLSEASFRVPSLFHSTPPVKLRNGEGWG